MPRTSSRLSRAVLLTLLVAGCLGLPRAHALLVHRLHKADTRQQIADLEQQWRTAVLNADVPLMDRLLSDDYVGISMAGVVNTKTMQLERLRTRTLNVTRMDLSDMKIKLVGGVAIVTSQAGIEGTNDGADIHGEFRYTRVYQRTPNGGWKITNFEATRINKNRKRA